MENKPLFYPNPDAKLMAQIREVLRYHHYAYRIERTYLSMDFMFDGRCLPVCKR